MKLLLHTCCGPCSIYPLRLLREGGAQVIGYFYRSNIHPFSECEKRLQTLERYAAQVELKLIVQKEYELEGFLRQAAYREKDRCRFCYYDRLKTTALLARKGKFEAFSSTLLYSKFQNHALIHSIGEAVAVETGIAFYYHDFRTGWKEGIEQSRRLDMYRQQYCGCIYSEKERFTPRITTPSPQKVTEP